MPRPRQRPRSRRPIGPPGFRARVLVLFNRPGQCRWCRCTEREPCPGGCGWTDATATLCTACQTLDRAAKTIDGRIALAELAQGCIDVDEFNTRGGA